MLNHFKIGLSVFYILSTLKELNGHIALGLSVRPFVFPLQNLQNLKSFGTNGCWVICYHDYSNYIDPFANKAARGRGSFCLDVYIRKTYKSSYKNY